MIPLLFLASISRCAVVDLCPSDAELTAAVRARDSAFVQALSDQLNAENPSKIVLVHSQRIMRITGAICGDEVQDEPAIMCKYTVRYWDQDAYVVAKLVKRDGGWEIVDELRVTRDRN